MITAKNAARQPFLPVLRDLVRAYQGFTSYDAQGYRDSGLTVSQADVIFTLGNTDGLTFREIGELTLITKGTLTGVVDRLQAKGLVSRHNDHEDGRCSVVRLTAKGVRVFEKEFPRQVKYIKQCFDKLSCQELDEIHAALKKLRQIFS